MKRIVLIVYLLITGAAVFPQASIRDSSIFITEVKMSYAAQMPVGQLAERFGLNSSLGLEVMLKTRSRLNVGIQGTFLFGNNLKETSILDPLRDEQGQIIDLNGEYAKVLTMERGFTLCASVGYLLPVLGPNPNSGLLFKLGGGFMQHKIRIESDRNPVPQLQGDYIKGYDRLTNGFALTQFLGYQYLSNRRLINFYFGVEAFEGLTKNRRPINFDTAEKDDAQRTDILIGLRAGWILPIYPRPPKAIYYN